LRVFRERNGWQDERPDPVTSEDTHTPEQEIERLRKELAFLEKKFQIVGSVTRHDILNQMTAIMGYNELVLSMESDEKLRGFLEIERRATEKIRRIFAYSKVYGNIGAEKPRFQKLDALVRMATEEADPGPVKVVLDVHDCSLLLDLQAVKVFAYLFDNAARHGRRTTMIRITLDTSGPAPVLVVEDDGEGIAPEEKEKIFERGYGKQTGWGLFVARDILAMTGMTIKETGTAGKGARFEIAVPKDAIRPG
jgi:signal transduction histidine kinase